MRVIWLAFMAVCLTAGSQEMSKPAVSMKMMPPDPIPHGSCNQDEFGYLDTGDGPNHWKPYGADELGEYLDDRAKKGFVVTVYPQPNGRLWVYAACGPKAAE